MKTNERTLALTHTHAHTHPHTHTPNKLFLFHLIINCLSFHRKNQEPSWMDILNLGNTYHRFQFAKWMECWEKFSFITSFSKGLIGYSLRYSREREAAVCMSGVVGRVEGVQGSGGVVQGEELRTRQTGEYIKEAEGEDSTYCRILPAWLMTRWRIKCRLLQLRDFFFNDCHI